MGKRRLFIIAAAALLLAGGAFWWRYGQTQQVSAAVLTTQAAEEKRLATALAADQQFSAATDAASRYAETLQQLSQIERTREIRAARQGVAEQVRSGAILPEDASAASSAAVQAVQAKYTDPLREAREVQADIDRKAYDAGRRRIKELQDGADEQRQKTKAVQDEAREIENLTKVEQIRARSGEAAASREQIRQEASERRRRINDMVGLSVADRQRLLGLVDSAESASLGLGQGSLRAEVVQAGVGGGASAQQVLGSSGFVFRRMGDDVRGIREELSKATQAIARLGSLANPVAVYAR
jgi:hypothetical protein